MDNQPPSMKNPDLSSFPRGAISMKGIPLARNTRLPTIRAARDLTLGALPKRNFQPNIPVRREKKTSTPNRDSNSQNQSETVDNDVSKKFSHLDLKWKHKPKTIIQTEGAPFAEGVAASTSKNAADKQRESVPRFTPKRTVVKKDLDLSDMKKDNGLDELLRDDFIDDDDEEEEEDDIKPIIYPVQEGEKIVKKESQKAKPQNFEPNLAKEMGYDVNKIAQFIKKEKGFEEIEVPVTKMDIPACAENELTKLFISGEQQMFLLKLPREFNVIHPDDAQKDFAEELSDNTVKDKPDVSSLPEGKIGALQILKSGKVRLAVGNNYFYFSQGTALKNKKEVVSIQTDENNKDLVVLGNIEHTLIVTPDVDKLLPPVR